MMKLDNNQKVLNLIGTITKELDYEFIDDQQVNNLKSYIDYFNKDVLSNYNGIYEQCKNDYEKCQKRLEKIKGDDDHDQSDTENTKCDVKRTKDNFTWLRKLPDSLEKMSVNNYDWLFRNLRNFSIWNEKTLEDYEIGDAEDSHVDVDLLYAFLKLNFNDRKKLLSESRYVLSRRQFDKRFKRICEDEWLSDSGDEVEKLKDYVVFFDSELLTAYYNACDEAECDISDAKENLKEAISDGNNKLINECKQRLEDAKDYRSNFKEFTGYRLEYFTEDDLNWYSEHFEAIFSGICTEDGWKMLSEMDDDLRKRLNFNDEAEEQIIRLFLKMKPADRYQLVRHYVPKDLK